MSKKNYKSCKLTEHIILNHGGVLDQNKLKVTAIDSIENMDPPEDCVNIAKWRENKVSSWRNITGHCYAPTVLMV